MSASLVGSEMCIRDRGGGSPPERERKKLLTARLQCFKRLQRAASAESPTGRSTWKSQPGNHISW
eukprot:1386612-Alexandrium_andersonii.AAC.1